MPQLSQYIKSGSRMPGADSTVERIVIGLPGTPTELIIYQGKIYVYDTNGQTLIDGGYISTNAIEAASIAVNAIALNSQGYVNNVPFTATDNNTCSWESGSIVFADGTQVVNNPGGTGNMTTTTYVYYDGSSANLRTTTDLSLAVGSSVVTLAILTPVPTDEGECIITPFISVGTTIDADKIITGRVSSVNLKTYFDLVDNRIQIDDDKNARVVIGKMSDGSYGIKASLSGYTADVDTNVNHYALWATSDDSVDNVLIKEKTRGSVSVASADWEEVSHGLGYVPFALVFVEDSANTYIKCYGWDMAEYGLYYSVNETSLILGNETGATKTFKYYIFYDRVAIGNYEEIYVHEHAPVTDTVII